ncbi:MAG: prolyl oligopeptidase family serine peptidase [Candidatus Thorarchaeota archaeon]
MEDSNFLDTILSLPQLYGFRISPNGKNIAFGWLNVHPDMDVFYKEINSDKDPIALTNTRETTELVNFFPKSDAVLVSQDRDNNERSQFFRVNLIEPLKMIPLTEDNPCYFIRGGDIDPDEKYLFYSANYDIATQREIEPSYIYRQNLRTNERVVLAKPIKPGWTKPELSKNGELLIYNRKDLHPKGEQIWLVDCNGNDDREILRFSDKARVTAQWLKDNRTIAFLTDTKDGSVQKHYSFGFYHIDTEEIEWIIDDPMRNIEEFQVSTLGNTIIVIEYKKASPKISILNLDTMKENPIPKISGNLIPKEPLGKNDWLGIYYSSTNPLDVVQIKLDDINPLKFKSLLNIWNKTSLKKQDLIQAIDYNWKGKDGKAIHGWLYKPKISNEKTIVFIHGGPTSHSKDAINPQIQYYTNKGFTVLDPNYRGSTGYGLEFEELIKEHGWGSDEQDDILSGIESLIEQGLSFKGKIGITGTSYGGYSSWFAITKFPKEFIAAAAPICGMTDLIVDYETTRPDLKPYSEEMLGGNPSEVPDVYYERSPINFISNIQGKLLIIQGAKDPNVTPRNVEVVKKHLNENNIGFDLLIFDDEGHGIIKTKNRKVLYQKIADFFDKTL